MENLLWETSAKSSIYAISLDKKLDFSQFFVRYNAYTLTYSNFCDLCRWNLLWILPEPPSGILTIFCEIYRLIIGTLTIIVGFVKDDTHPHTHNRATHTRTHRQHHRRMAASMPSRLRYFPTSNAQASHNCLLQCILA